MKIEYQYERSTGLYDTWVRVEIMGVEIEY